MTKYLAIGSQAMFDPLGNPRRPAIRFLQDPGQHQNDAARAGVLLQAAIEFASE